MNQKLQDQKHQVALFDIHGNKLGEFPTVTKAHKVTGHSKSNIYKSIKGKLREGLNYSYQSLRK